MHDLIDIVTHVMRARPPTQTQQVLRAVRDVVARPVRNVDDWLVDV